MVNKYDKLVRDKIPEIIKQNGGSPKVEILNDESYFNALNRKLTEEVAEYLEKYSVEELADIMEVIHAIAKHKELTMADLECIRLKKLDERGGFDGRISLVEVDKRGIKP